MMKGPGQWRGKSDPFYLKESFGQRMSFRNISASAKAAQLRVYFKYENARVQVGADSNLASISDLHNNLLISRIGSPYASRKRNWADWYDNSFAKVLKDNAISLQNNYGITIEGIRSEIAGCPRPWTEEMREKMQKLFQKTVTKIENHFIKRPAGHYRES